MQLVFTYTMESKVGLLSRAVCCFGPPQILIVHSDLSPKRAKLVTKRNRPVSVFSKSLSLLLEEDFIY